MDNKTIISSDKDNLESIIKKILSSSDLQSKISVYALFTITQPQYIKYVNMSIESKDYGLWVEIRKIFQPTLWDKIKSIFSFTSRKNGLPEQLIKEDTTKDFNVVKQIEELPKIKNVSIDVTRKSTRFYVTRSDYEVLALNPNSFLVIECNPRSNNHPRGKYKIPNKKARQFISGKQNTPNWDSYGNFKQDAIPVGLEEYFTRT